MLPETATTSQTSSASLGKRHFKLAQTSLKQTMERYSHLRSQQITAAHPDLTAKLQTYWDTLVANWDKLEQRIIRIAAFGLVSRGKSAVLNGLVGQQLLQTGPINGVTQWPRCIPWTFPESNGTASLAAFAPEGLQIELIDTPGLDEVAGQIRGDMAKEVTRQADLILFVVSGDITRTEYEALWELRQAQKPLILVFNKIDLYPEAERQAIYQNLQKIGMGDGTVEVEGDVLLPNPPGETPSTPPVDIVMVAAEPTPRQVRIEWPDGRMTHQWETPAPQIETLKQKILGIIQREGYSLLALNALVQTKAAEGKIAHLLLKLQQTAADDLIWQFAKYKALAVALNPVALLDVFGTIAADLVLIRSLARLYGLPMTRYEAGKLWKTILLSAGGMILGELGSGLMLGLGKTAAGILADISTYGGVAATQASLGAYGTYAVGRAAQAYLEKGCTWGLYGQDTIIQEILNQVEANTVIYRLRQEFQKEAG